MTEKKTTTHENNSPSLVNMNKLEIERKIMGIEREIISLERELDKYREALEE